MVSIFIDCCRPILYPDDNRLGTIRGILTFFVEKETTAGLKTTNLMTPECREDITFAHRRIQGGGGGGGGGRGGTAPPPPPC